MQERMIYAMNRTWENIGGIVLQVYSGTLSQDQLIASVLEKDHLEDYGDDTEAVNKLRSLSSLQLTAITLLAFPFPVYSTKD